MAKDALTTISQKITRIDAEIRRVLAVESVKLQKRIQSKHLGGSRTTNTRLRGRSGRLQKSVVVIQPRTRGNTSTSEVRIQSPYASVHFGRKGETTVIRPKSARALAIPTKFAQDANGVALGPTDSSKFKNTFVANGKIFGQVGSGEFVPLFVLKNQVRVPVRIDIQDNLLRPILKPLEARLARVLRNF